MRVSVWWCTRTSSNPFDLRSVSESSVYFALSFVRLMVVGDAGRSGQGDFDADRGRGTLGRIVTRRGPRRGVETAPARRVPEGEGACEKPLSFSPHLRGCVKKKLDRETGRVTHHSSASLFRVGALLYMCSTRSMTATS